MDVLKQKFHEKSAALRNELRALIKANGAEVVDSVLIAARDSKEWDKIFGFSIKKLTKKKSRIERKFSSSILDIRSKEILDSRPPINLNIELLTETEAPVFTTQKVKLGHFNTSFEEDVTTDTIIDVSKLKPLFIDHSQQILEILEQDEELRQLFIKEFRAYYVELELIIQALKKKLNSCYNFVPNFAKKHEYIDLTTTIKKAEKCSPHFSNLTFNSLKPFFIHEIFKKRKSILSAA